MNNFFYKKNLYDKSTNIVYCLLHISTETDEKNLIAAKRPPLPNFFPFINFFLNIIIFTNTHPISLFLTHVALLLCRSENTTNLLQKRVSYVEASSIDLDLLFELGFYQFGLNLVLI